MTATKSKTPKGKGTYSFYTTGEGLTNMIRDAWVSDTPKQALNICKNGLGMTGEQAIEVITGKKKLTGDSRDNNGLGWEDDNITKVSGIPLSVEVMVSRLEKNYIDHSEAINTFNAVNEDLLSEIDFEESMKTLSYYKKKQADTLEQLQEVYALIGKALKDLPNDKIRSAQKIKKDYKENNPKEFEEVSKNDLDTLNLSVLSNVNTEFGDVLEKMDSLTDRAKKLNRKSELVNKLASKIPDGEQKTEDINAPRTTNGYGGKYFVVHTPVDKCKKEGLGSGWLLPDGTFFGGRSNWIHKFILEDLQEMGFFKDKNYSSAEDDVQEKGGWIRMSDFDWMIWEHKVNPTKEQVEFIIQYTIEVSETNFIEINKFTKIHIQVFAEILNGREFDSYKMKKESEGMPELEKESFPSVKEVSDIEPLCEVFFEPDKAFVKWLINYANGRTIVDVGCGSGYLTALINKHGGNVLAIEPRWSMKRKMFWVEKGFMFNAFSESAETCKFVLDLPHQEKLLYVFARPCHSGFVERTINKIGKGAEILYISHTEQNKIVDLPTATKYTKLEHEGTSKDNEFVLSIKK